VKVTSCQWPPNYWRAGFSTSIYGDQGGAVWLAISGALWVAISATTRFAWQVVRIVEKVCRFQEPKWNFVPEVAIDRTGCALKVLEVIRAGGFSQINECLFWRCEKMIINSGTRNSLGRVYDLGKFQVNSSHWLSGNRSKAIFKYQRTHVL
jgi:hypothetical protein